MVAISQFDNNGLAKTLMSIGGFKSINNVRAKAYRTIKDDNVSSVRIYADGGMECIGEVLIHRAGVHAGKRYYYPDYSSSYYKKRENMRYPKYLLNKDGSLGKGAW